MVNYCKYKDPHGDEIGSLIRKVVKLWQRALQRDIDEYKITVSQLELLSAVMSLKEENTEVTQIALSQETGIDPMTTSTIIRNMQKRGLITREESKIDTRARVVELTDAGLEILDKTIDKIKNLQTAINVGGIDENLIKNQLQILHNNLNNLNNNYKN